MATSLIAGWLRRFLPFLGWISFLFQMWMMKFDTLIYLIVPRRNLARWVACVKLSSLGRNMKLSGKCSFYVKGHLLTQYHEIRSGFCQGSITPDMVHADHGNTLEGAMHW